MRPKGSTKDRLPIYEEEFQRLINFTRHDKSIHKETRVKLIRAYTLLYLTGCRVSEIIGFTLHDVEVILQSGAISLSNNTKTKKPRALLFSTAGRELLSSSMYLACKSKGLYLFYAKGKNHPMGTAVFTRILNEHLARALGGLYTTHSFRAGYITRIVEATGNPETARSLVGHSSINTTMSYLSTSTKQKQEALERVFSEGGL